MLSNAQIIQINRKETEAKDKEAETSMKEVIDTIQTNITEEIIGKGKEEEEAILMKETENTEEEKKDLPANIHHMMIVEEETDRVDAQLEDQDLDRQGQDLVHILTHTIEGDTAEEVY